MNTLENKKEVTVIEQPILALSRARSNRPRKRKVKTSMKRSVRDERIRDGNRKVIN